MRVQVRLYASLRKYLPVGHASDTVAVEVPAGASARDVIAALRIPPEQTKMIVSNNEQLDAGATLQDGQELNLFPPLAGGA